MTTLTRTPDGTPVLGIAGWKNSGKTTLAVRLIEQLTRRGLRVASVKHAHHAFDVDTGDTDSARHRRAGAREVAVISARRAAFIRELDGAAEPPLEEVLSRLAPADIVIVEGYKRAPITKIEVVSHRSVTRERLAATDPLVIAVASDDAQPDQGRLPTFDNDDIDGMTTFVLKAAGLA